MEERKVFETIREIVMQKLNLTDQVEKITPEVDLAKDFHVNSMKLINLIGHLEDEFNIELDIDALETETLTNLSKLTSLIQKIVYT